MLRKGNFIFTNRNHPPRAVLATVLGALGWGTVLLAIHLTFRNGGVSTPRLGTAGLLAFLFVLAGCVLAVLSRLEKDKYYLFSYLGIFLNGSCLAFSVYLLYAGQYGI